ncbi:MAG: hypothetical protein OXM02_01070 [Bacteroidota bacterium]|nr:hypothetical protein [Bacteroidota bacterium]
MARSRHQRRKGRSRHKPASSRQTRTEPRLPAEGSLWDKLTPLQQHLACGLVLLLVAIVFCGPVLFSDRALVGGDTVQWRAAAESLLEYREQTGEEPLWATNVFGGMPGHVISPPAHTPQIHELPRLLRKLSWPLSHVLTLLAGAYLLVWFLTRNTLSSVLAACAYGLTTYLPVILVAGHNSKFVALAYAPWLILAFAYVIRHPGAVSGLLFAIALAANLQGGHVQITYYTAIIVGIWWLAEGLQAVRSKRPRRWLATTGILVGCTVLAVLMVTEIYWPIWEYKAYSIRGMASGGGEGGISWQYAMAWSQGRAELLTLLIADAFGGSSLYWGPKTYTGGPHYAGGIILLLAAIALWQIRSRLVGALGIAAGLMMLFALGENFGVLNRLMYNFLPLFNAFRAPETWLIAVVLVLTLLAGIGLTWITCAAPSLKVEAQKTRSIQIACGAAAGIAVLLWLMGPSLLSFEKDQEIARVLSMAAQQTGRPTDDPQLVQAVAERFDEELRTPRQEAFQRDAGRTVLFLVVGGLLIILYRRQSLPAWLMQAGLILLVVLDMTGVARRYLNEQRLARSQDPAQLIQSLDVDRYILEQEGQFRVLSLERQDQTGLARPSYYHESLGGYSAAKLRLYQDYLDHVLFDPTTGQPNQNALDLLSTRYVISRNPVQFADLAYRGETSGFNVYENLDYQPRAWLVGEVEVIANPTEVWARLQDTSFDPARTAIVASPLTHPIIAVDSGSVVEVVPQEHSPRRLSYMIETDAPRLLILSEVYYPAGWMASVNGEPEDIIRANYLLRAIPVPAGSSTVTLQFEPASYTWGRRISMASTILVYGLLLVLVWRRRTAT